MTIIAAISIPICATVAYPIDVCPMDIPPPISTLCLSLTNYWVWDENGDILPGFHGQCDEDCSTMASGYKLPAREEDYVGDYAACIQEWTSRAGYPTMHIHIDGATNELACVDTFGRESYRKPFYHLKWDRWVIPVDILRKFPVAGVWCEYETRWAIPQEVTQ